MTPIKPRVTLSEDDRKAIIAGVAAALKPLLIVTPLHELSADELRDETTKAVASFITSRRPVR